MRGTFRHLAALTTGLTFVLILLGVYTGSMGAGLACEARWPLCDGWLGLFPDTWPSFIEWSHRTVAMITGFLVLGLTYLAYRGEHDRKILAACVLATVLLPVQVLLGANTVWNFGITAQILHHGAAQLIFGSLVVATVLAYVEADDRPRSGGRSRDGAPGDD